MKNKKQFILKRMAWIMVISFCLMLVCGVSKIGTISACAAEGSEIDAYVKFLKNRQKLLCQGTTHYFKPSAFNMIDINGDGTYELIVLDKTTTCKNSSHSSHGHMMIYKYSKNKMELINGVLTALKGEKIFYFSKAKKQILVKDLSNRWYGFRIYGIVSAGKMSAFPGYTKYVLYENNEKNRDDILISEKEKIYFKKMAEIERQYQKLENTLNKNGKRIFNEVSGECEALKAEPREKLSGKIKTILASNLPKSAEKAFIKKFTDTIESTLLVKSTSYNNCNTAAQLVNKVAQQIVTEEGAFTFIDKKQVYRVSFQSIGVPGATYVQGNITSGGKSYIFGGTVTSKTSIKEELDNLKKYSDKKVEEAKEAVFSDATGLLIPDGFKSYMSSTLKSKLYKEINKKAPTVALRIKKSIDMINKFKTVEKTYKDLNALDLKYASAAQVAKTIATYNKKLEAYTKAIENLF